MLAPARESPSSLRRQPWKPSNNSCVFFIMVTLTTAGNTKPPCLISLMVVPPSLFVPISTTTELCRVVFSVHPTATTMTTPRSRVCISPKQPRITNNPRTSAHQLMQPQPFVRHRDNSGTRSHLQFSTTVVESYPSAFLPPPRQLCNLRSTIDDSQTLMGRLS